MSPIFNSPPFSYSIFELLLVVSAKFPPKLDLRIITSSKNKGLFAGNLFSGGIKVNLAL